MNSEEDAESSDVHTWAYYDRRTWRELTPEARNYLRREYRFLRDRDIDWEIARGTINRVARAIGAEVFATKIRAAKQILAFGSDNA